MCYKEPLNLLILKSICVFSLAPQYVKRPPWIQNQQMVSGQRGWGFQRAFVYFAYRTPILVTKLHPRILTPVHTRPCSAPLSWREHWAPIRASRVFSLLGNQSSSRTGGMSFQGKKNIPRLTVSNVNSSDWTVKPEATDVFWTRNGEMMVFIVQSWVREPPPAATCCSRKRR